MHTTRSPASRRPPHQRGPGAQQQPVTPNWDTGPDLFGNNVLPEQFFTSQYEGNPIATSERGGK